MSSLTIIGRATWGAGPLKAGHRVPESQFKGIVVHHTVMVMGDYDRDGFLHGDVDDVKRYMRQLQSARPDLGPEVPYSWVVFRGAHANEAIVAEGRGFGVTGAHTAGYNSSRYGVAYAGNAEVDPITEGILDGIRWVGSHITARPVAATIGHRDTKATACPGRNLYAKLGEIQPPFPTEEDDMTEAELRVELERGKSRQLVKDIATGAGVDALRPRTDANPDRGAWRGLFKEILNEVLDERAGG